MTTPEALSSLRAYQAWRRGTDERTMDEAGITPAQVGRTIGRLLAIALFTAARSALTTWHARMRTRRDKGKRLFR